MRLRLTLCSLIQRERRAADCKMEEVNDPSLEQRITRIHDNAYERIDEDGDGRWMAFK